MGTDVFAGNPALRQHWHPVCGSTDLPGPVEVTLLGEPLVVYRGPDGAVVAAPDRCPHREAPLSAGSVTDGVLRCSYHGWEFGSDGACVRVPSSAEGVPVPPKAALCTHHAREQYGLVWVCLDDPVADVPVVPQEADDAYRRINNPVEVWATCALRMTDNFLDFSHFPFVHTGTFGIAQNTEIPKLELEDLDDTFHGYAYEVDVLNELGTVASGEEAPVLHRRMTTGYALPFTVRSTIEYESGLHHILLLCTTPIDDVTSYFTFVVWRNDDFSVSAEEVMVFDRAIGAEDKAMLEQLHGVLPLDATGVVSVQADKASVDWRRRFVELLD